MERNWGVVTVRARDGKVWIYESLDHAVRDFYENEIENLTDHLNFPWEDFNLYRGTPFKFFDCLGLRIPVWAIKEAYYNLPPLERKTFRWMRRRKKRYRFRDGPVPGIRCSRGGGYGYFRGIRTTAESREIVTDRAGDDLEYQIPWRRKSLPNAWDDISRVSIRDRSWKRHRKTQYK